MRLLTNTQRECFGLQPICEQWDCIEAKPGRNDCYKTILYLDGNEIVKCITAGDTSYCEYELSEQVSPDREYLLPKTDKGKPVRFTASTIAKRNGVGMRLSFISAGRTTLYNLNTNREYFSDYYLSDRSKDLDSFWKWVENWCNETTDTDKADILLFSQQMPHKAKYREGDVFRFKIGRRHYGYGRILLDYGKMRKNKEPFWDIIGYVPLVCSVYHIMTERSDIKISELEKLDTLPSTLIADNSLYYGEYPIIGNIPISNREDYPIMYGNSIAYRERAVCYQCGKVFRKIENEKALYSDFINNAIGFYLNVRADVLSACIKEKSNDPYWNLYYEHATRKDLRNPKHKEVLIKITKQFGLSYTG